MSLNLYSSTHEHDAERDAVAACGHVIDTPSVSLWGFPVNTMRLRIPVPIAADPDPDCWFVWLCVGSLRQVPALIPYRLPYIVFVRDNILPRAYSFDHLLRKLP